jgi:hypothetical protein
MSRDANAKTECGLVGEYVDEMELPASASYPIGEVVRPRLVGEYLDEGVDGESLSVS